jgi:hypothetical protein
MAKVTGGVFTADNAGAMADAESGPDGSVKPGTATSDTWRD